MLSQLNDKIRRAIDEGCDAGGRIRVHSVVESVVTQLDREEEQALLREAVGGRVKSISRQKVTADSAQPTTGDLFPELHRRYALDEKEQVIKNTADLSQLEFQKIIRIREESVSRDMAHLKVLREAFNTVAPTWSAHPDWTFSQVCRAHREAA